MENRARDGSIAHIKVWGDAGNGDGTVLWSDLEPLIGQTFELEEEEYAVFGTDDTVSDISNLEKVENALERGEGQLVEVYTGTRNAPALRCCSRSTSPRRPCRRRCAPWPARSSRCRSSR